MYKIEDIRDIHLEVTSRCQARCPMCPRRINGGIPNPLFTLDREISIDDFKNWFSVEFIKQLDSLFMCGNLGDPIIAKDCLKIFEYLREVNPRIRTSMHTNGSARDKDWWIRLAKTQTRVVFGIDGLRDTHELYRISTDWDKIIENAKAFINAGGRAEWHMLAFAHNEYQIEDCRKLSEELGFDKFQVKHTARFENNKFHVLDDHGKTINILLPTNPSKEHSTKIFNYIHEVNPVIKCKVQSYKQFYVSAMGYISPCCWLDMKEKLHKHDTRMDFMDKVGEFPNLYNNTLQEIFDSGFFEKIAKTWGISPLLECSRQCGNFDKLGAQFENRS